MSTSQPMKTIIKMSEGGYGAGRQRRRFVPPAVHSVLTTPSRCFATGPTRLTWSGRHEQLCLTRQTRKPSAPHMQSEDELAIGTPANNRLKQTARGRSGAEALRRTRAAA